MISYIMTVSIITVTITITIISSSIITSTTSTTIAGTRDFQWFNRWVSAKKALLRVFKLDWKPPRRLVEHLRRFPYDISLRSERRSATISEKIYVLQPPRIYV